MKLITKEILKLLPPLYSTSELESSEIKVPLKLFNPVGTGTWYITEYDKEKKIAFGCSNRELGYISITELESVTLKYGLKIERDLYWDKNTTLKEVMNL